MPATDFADWTQGVTIVTGSIPPMSDFPDWTKAIQVSGGGGGGAYASLTGPGETTTPGDLTQAGSFTVNAGTDADQFNVTVAGILLRVEDSTPTIVGSLQMTNTTPGLEIDTQDLIIIKSEQSNVEVRADNASVSIIGDTTGFGGIVMDASNISIGVTSGDKIGFFNPGGGPVGKQTITGSRGGNVALANLLTALANLGLITNSTTV